MLVMQKMLTKERKGESYKHYVFDINMERYIDKKLTKNQWSPEQIKGRCNLDAIAIVSIERIYQYIYENQSKERL